MTSKEATFIRAAAVAAAVTVVLGACGGDDGDGGVAGEADVTVVGFDSFSFDQDEYTVPAGEVTFEYVNEGQLRHTLVVEGEDDFKLAVNARGDTDRGSIELEPGEYVIYCDEPGHAGMEATLTVTG